MICHNELSELSEHALAAFRQELLTYLRLNLSAQTRGLDDSALMERILDSERRALGYGIADNAAIAWFTCMEFGFGPKFDLQPEVQVHLRREDRPADDRLFDVVDYFQWCEAAGTLLLSPEEADEVLTSALGE